jgi:hypothetical protein
MMQQLRLIHVLLISRIWQRRSVSLCQLHFGLLDGAHLVVPSPLGGIEIVPTHAAATATTFDLRAHDYQCDRTLTLIAHAHLLGRLEHERHKRRRGEPERSRHAEQVELRGVKHLAQRVRRVRLSARPHRRHRRERTRVCAPECTSGTRRAPTCAGSSSSRQVARAASARWPVWRVGTRIR